MSIKNLEDFGYSFSELLVSGVQIEIREFLLPFSQATVNLSYSFQPSPQLLQTMDPNSHNFEVHASNTIE